MDSSEVIEDSDMSSGPSPGRTLPNPRQSSRKRNLSTVKELRRMESSLNSSINEVTDKVCRLEAKQPGPPTKKQATEHHPESWAVGEDGDLSNVPLINWSDHDGDSD